MLKKLTILHSNDMHGDFLAEEIDEKLVGGVSMLSGYIQKVREEEKNVLYCIAGDMFRGSVIDSEYKGYSTIEIVNSLGPDVVTIGNHETDYGLEHLLFIEKCARFPIINANMHITTNNARLFKPCQIIRIGGMKILFIGILTQDVIAATKADVMVGTMVNVQDAAMEVARICNAYNSLDVDLTVLLTHIGYEKDIELAKMLDPALGVDIIIGGHSHTLPDKAITENGILIVQAGVGTDQIGRFDMMIDTDKNCVDSYEWKTIPITEENCPKDKKMELLINNFKRKTDIIYGTVLTHLRCQLTHPERGRETNLGNLYADILSKALGTDLFLVGSGSIRTEKLGPVVTLQDLNENFPYDDPALAMKVTGKQFREMIRHMLRDEAFVEGGHTEFYQVNSAVRITYDQKTHDFTRFDFNGKPIEEDRLYTLGLQKYHYSNFKEAFGCDSSEIEKENGKARTVATSVVQIIQEYLVENQRLHTEVEGRLEVHKA